MARCFPIRYFLESCSIPDVYLLQLLFSSPCNSFFANVDNRMSENKQDIRQSHKLHHEVIQSRKKELAGGKNLAKFKIQRGTFPGDAFFS